MKQKFIEYYMSIAELTATMSHATKLKVGCIIVKDHRTISCGYNGTPAGWDNVCENKEWMSGDVGGWLSPDEICENWPHVATSDEDGAYIGRYRLKTKPEVIHAEANSIVKLARDGESGNGASLFCTHAPCIDCAKLIFGAGIKQVFYRDEYRTDDGIKFLTKSGVDVVRHEQTAFEDH